MSEWFRTRFHCQAIGILEELQQQHLISFLTLGRGKVIKYKIRGWKKHNTVLEYNAPCQKDTIFFFLPVSLATEMISTGRYSEMDIVMDLWLLLFITIAGAGAEIDPVTYLRNGTGNPLVTYSELGTRWGVSKATVGRVLKKNNKMVFKKNSWQASCSVSLN